MCSETKWAIMQFVLFYFLFVAPLTVQAELYMSVSGKVIAADNAAPLSGIRVLLMSPEKGKINEVKSNSQGTFVLRDVPKGQYDLLAIPEDPFVVSSKQPVPVTVPDGKNVVGVAMKAQRGGAIRGKVVTSTGIVIPKATVLGNSGISTTTDDYGNFLLKGVTPGTVTLAVTAPAIAAKAVSIVSEAGKITEAGNVVLPIGVESAIRGTVVDVAGNPVPGAIVAASTANATGGYTIASDTGAFFITGLGTATTYQLNVVAYGYEPVKLTDIPVPSSGVKVVLVPSPVKTASLIKYQLTIDRNDVEAMYEKIIPASYYGNCREERCPEGNWLGASLDVTGMINVPGLSLAYGGTMSVGSYYCLSSGEGFGFTQTCNYYGAGLDRVAVLSFGVTGIYAKNACCAENILDPSTDGVVYGWGYGVGGGAVAFESNNVGVSFISGSATWSPLGGVLQVIAFPVSHSVTYRHCSSSPFNIFAWVFGDP